MVCGNFILPEPASYVFFYAFFNLRNLLYLIADPLHRIGSFRLLCDAFRLSHLLYQPREHLLCLPVDVGKVAVQLSTSEQGRMGTPSNPKALVQSFILT